MSCGEDIVKLVIFAVNFVIVLGAGAVVGACIAVNVNGGVMAELQKAIADSGQTVDLASYRSAIWVLAAVAAVVLLVGLLGCMGVCCESSCLMFLYMACIAVIVVTEIIIIVIIFVQKKNIEPQLEKAMADLKGDALKPIQDQLVCCGVSGTPLQGGTCTDEEKKAGGCYDKIISYINKYSLPALLIAIIVIMSEFVAAIFACLLIGTFRRASYSY